MFSYLNTHADYIYRTISQMGMAELLLLLQFLFQDPQDFRESLNFWTVGWHIQFKCMCMIYINVHITEAKIFGYWSRLTNSLCCVCLSVF